MSRRPLIASISLAFAACAAPSGNEGANGAGAPPGAERLGEAAEAFSTCGPKPSDPCYSWQCDTDGFWEAVGVVSGVTCQGTGRCDSAGNCVMPPAITTPAISGIYMYSPSQTSFVETCATGTTATTTTLKVSIDGGAWTTLPNTCSLGSGQRWDDYNVGPRQNRCYAISASNASGTVNGVTRCFTTPDDLTTPTPPGGGVSPYVGGTIINIVDLSTNETQLRAYYRRAGQSAPWQLVCSIERYNAYHWTGFPHAGLYDPYQCGVDKLTPGVDYEVMLEAFHDNAPLSGTKILPPFQVWSPNDVHITQTTPNPAALFVQSVATPGQKVILEINTIIDLTGYESIPFAENVVVTAAPNAIRTPLNLGPRIFTKSRPKFLFSIACNDGLNARGVKLSGFRLEGPDYATMDGDDYTEQGIHIDGCTGVDIGNMEISGWSGEAVQVVDRDSTPHYVGTGDVHVHDCYIHNNQHTGKEGYGVATSDGGKVTIERNVFDFNRHSIMSTGSPTASYTAQQNLILQGGGLHDKWYNEYTHVIDVHGNDPDCDYLCGIAGDWFEIHGNAVQYMSNENAAKIRGTPAFWANVTDNVFAHPDIDSAVAYTQGPLRITRDPNQVGVQSFGDYGVGDFDGDGRDDLFLATGVNWWFMSAGKTYWTYLSAHLERLRDVALGDFDGDGRCDVFKAYSNGTWWIASGGGSDWTYLGSYPGIAPSDLRFGDFNGDHVTDIFYTDANGQWWAVSPGHGGPRALASSGYPIGELRLGDFNGDGITDVLSRSGGHWAASWGGTTGWQWTGSPLNQSLDDQGIIVADVDDVPGDDLIFYSAVDRTHGQWWISSNATTDWRLWASYAFDESLDNPHLPALSQTAHSFYGHWATSAHSDLLMVTGMVVAPSAGLAEAWASIVRRGFIYVPAIAGFSMWGLFSY